MPGSATPTTGPWAGVGMNDLSGSDILNLTECFE
jgi:hypothetical protein